MQGPPSGGPPKSEELASEMLSKLDADGDGSISKAEWASINSSDSTDTSLVD
jgi:hypothetical protein